MQVSDSKGEIVANDSQYLVPNQGLIIGSHILHLLKLWGRQSQNYGPDFKMRRLRPEPERLA